MTRSVDEAPITSTSLTSFDLETPLTASTNSALVPPETSLDSVVETADPLGSAQSLDATEIDTSDLGDTITASSAVKRSFALDDDDDDDKDTNEDPILSSKRSKMDGKSTMP